MGFYLRIVHLNIASQYQKWAGLCVVALAVCIQIRSVAGRTHIKIRLRTLRYQHLREMWLLSWSLFKYRYFLLLPVLATRRYVDSYLI